MKPHALLTAMAALLFWGTSAAARPTAYEVALREAQARFGGSATVSRRPFVQDANAGVAAFSIYVAGRRQPAVAAVVATTARGAQKPLGLYDIVQASFGTGRVTVRTNGPSTNMDRPPNERYSENEGLIVRIRKSTPAQEVRFRGGSAVLWEGKSEGPHFATYLFRPSAGISEKTLRPRFVTPGAMLTILRYMYAAGYTDRAEPKNAPFDQVE